VPAGPRGLDDVLRVQARGGADGDQVDVVPLKHLGVVGVGGADGAEGSGGCTSPVGQQVAGGDEGGEAFGVEGLDGVDVVLADAAAAEESDPDHENLLKSNRRGLCW